MSLTLPNGVERHVREVLSSVVEQAREASEAPDTEAMKHALAATWHAVHRAHEVIRDAERVTRAQALAELEHRAA